MNLRLGNGRLRFRVTHSELLALDRGTPLSETFPFPDGRQLEIRIVNNTRADLLYDRGLIELAVRPDQLGQLRSDPPSREGLAILTATGDGNTVEARLQVDLRETRGRD